MLKSLLRLFTAQPEPPLFDRESAAVHRAAMVQVLAERERLSAAHRMAWPYALLTLAVPLPAREAGGWFGGAPRLPDDVAWPEINGVPLRFVCQIDLSEVPSNLWSGAGPRDGWLVVFLPATGPGCRILHVRGAVRRRDGPAQADADWFRPRPPAGPAVWDRSPEWPIEISGQVGPWPQAGFRKGLAPGWPDPREVHPVGLSDPACHPFDAATLEMLLGAMGAYLERQNRQIEVLLAKKLRKADRSRLAACTEAAAAIAASLGRTRAALSPFRTAEVGGAMAALAELPLPSVSWKNTDPEGFALVELTEAKVGDPVGPRGTVWWVRGYERALGLHAVQAYTRDPAALPAALRARMETLWAFDAGHERGAMGHAPRGYVPVPHGPATENEVLLELPTSDLVGWIWGDLYSLVFLIRRDDLARGHFGDVTLHVTN